MHFDIEITNTVAAVAFALVIFFLGGMKINNRRGR